MLYLSIVSYLLGNLGQALFIRSCHEDVIFTRKSHNCAGTAFVQGDSACGSKLTEQTLNVECGTEVDIKAVSHGPFFAFNYSSGFVSAHNCLIEKLICVINFFEFE